MNGAYFKDFRKWLLDECSLDVIAVYGSRQEHFKDMSILQEIMLLKVSKRPQTRSVTIYGNITPVRSLGSQPSVQASLDSITLGRDRIRCIQQQDSRLSGTVIYCRKTNPWTDTPYTGQTIKMD